MSTHWPGDQSDRGWLTGLYLETFGHIFVLARRPERSWVVNWIVFGDLRSCLRTGQETSAIVRFLTHPKRARIEVGVFANQFPDRIPRH